MIIASKKSLTPFLLLSLINAGLVLSTSFLLIPRMGIIGGAISQVIVSIISSSYVLIYALKTSTFAPTAKKVSLMAMMPLIGAYEIFVDPPYLDLLLVVLTLLAFKSIKIITPDDVKIIESFLPNKLRFVTFLLRIIV